MRGPRTRPSSTIGTTRIADGRKPAREHPFEYLRCLQSQQRDRPIRQAGECGIDGKNMDMRIDQPRHQGAAIEVDCLGRGARDRPVRYFPDVFPFDEDMVILAALSAGPVEHRGVGKNDCRHRVSPGCESRKIVRITERVEEMHRGVAKTDYAMIELGG
jgi:hypothetical protein